jgi:hypothetical protein
MKTIEETIEASKDASCDRLSSLENRVEKLEALASRMLDAADKAFQEACYVNQRFRSLPCIRERDTDPNCSVVSEHPGRNSLHSINDVEELSSVTAAIVTAATTAAVKEARRQKSGFPIQLSTPGGWAVKLSAVGAGLVGLAFGLWELFKSLPSRK